MSICDMPLRVVFCMNIKTVTSIVDYGPNIYMKSEKKKFRNMEQGIR